MRTEPRSGCPINAAIEVLGDPWSAVVLRDIIFGDRRYFRELLAGSEEGIASNVLSTRLKSLVAAGLLVRDEAVRGQRARYSLTEAGIQTLPVLVSLGAWGRRHRPTTPELTIRQQLMEDGGTELVADFMDELRHLHLGASRTSGPSVAQRLQEAYESLA